MYKYCLNLNRWRFFFLNLTIFEEFVSLKKIKNLIQVIIINECYNQDNLQIHNEILFLYHKFEDGVHYVFLWFTLDLSTTIVSK